MGMYTLLLTVGIIVLGGLYFIPTFIALGKKHKNSIGVFFLNLLLGFTFFGWLGALLLSLYKEKKKV